MADLILSKHPSELKQVSGCVTAQAVWQKIESIYSSKGPARKATLLKQLILQRLDEGGDIKEHIAKFFDIIDKLESMSVPINGDLLSIMLLYSLPKDFENFRCAIECRDELPTAEILKVKIIEESEARKIATGNAVNAMYTTNSPRNHQNIRTKYKHHVKPQFRCFKCHKIGHKASMCGFKNKNNDKDKSDRRSHEESYAAFYIKETADLSSNVVAHAAQVNKNFHKWILDSGCTAHLCCDEESFCSLNDDVNAKINLASAAHADVKDKGSVKLSVVDEHDIRAIELKNTLFAPDLRINLVSIAKITDRGHSVMFNKSGAYVYDEDGNEG